jgi:hypothetical protein
LRLALATRCDFAPVNRINLRLYVPNQQDNTDDDRPFERFHVGLLFDSKFFHHGLKLLDAPFQILNLRVLRLDCFVFLKKFGASHELALSRAQGRKGNAVLAPLWHNRYRSIVIFWVRVLNNRL